MVRAIRSHNGDSSHRHDVQFTAASATQMLPLVEHIVADLLRLRAAIDAQRHQVDGIETLVETINKAEYSDELSDIRQSLSVDQQRFDACLDELTALGIQPHVPFDGSLDFPAQKDRRQICLCWQPGDRRVEHWHEVGQPLDRRQSL